METEEKAPNTTENGQSSQGAPGAASKETVKPSEAKGGESLPADLTKTPEFQTAVQSVVKTAVADAYRTFQSTRDKELSPLLDRLTKAERQNEEARLRQQEVELQKDFDKQIDGEVAEGTLNEERGAYLKDWRRKAREEFMVTAKDKEEVKTGRAEIAKQQMKIVAYDVIAEGEKQGKVFSLADARKIAEDSKGIPEVMVRLVTLAEFVEEKPEEKGERKAPEGAAVSSGGRDWRKLSAKDKIRDALEREK